MTNSRNPEPRVSIPLAPPEPPPRVTKRFIAFYTLAYLSTTLLFIAPLLVTLALKINSLVGIERAPASLALVAGVGAFLALFANPFFGTLSDRTSGRFGRRRPWMLLGLVTGTAGVLVVAIAPNIPTVLVGWCVAQVGFNALLAAMAAVLPDKVPPAQRGIVAGVLGVCVPVAGVSGAALSFRYVAGTFFVNPRTNPDFGWVFTSRFLMVLAYSFLTTFLAYYLIAQLNSSEKDVPGQILLGTLAQSAVVHQACEPHRLWSVHDHNAVELRLQSRFEEQGHV